MKKLFIFIVFTFCMLFLVGCNVNDLVDKFTGDGDGSGTQTPDDGGGKTGDDGGSSITTSDDHKAEEVSDKVNQMISANGVFVKYEITSKSDGEDDVTVVIAFGAKDKVFYVNSGEEETYIDLSDDTKFIVYNKDEEGEWTKMSTPYDDEYFTKEQADEFVQAYFTLISSYMTQYQAFENLEATKSSETVAGRSCDKYTVKQATIGYSINYSFCIDKATGICMKWTVEGNSTEGSGYASFECKEFKTNYTITLPEARELNEGNGGEED